MSKRRTRKQKESAKHSFTVSWEGGRKEAAVKSNVKRQFGKLNKSDLKIINDKESADYSVKDKNLASIKKDLVKSLILASFILITEMVLYLIWRKS